MRKTGEGPPTQEYTPAEELAICNNEGCPLMEAVFWLRLSASPTAYIKVPVAKKRKAVHTVCGTVSEQLRHVTLAPSSMGSSTNGDAIFQVN